MLSSRLGDRILQLQTEYPFFCDIGSLRLQSQGQGSSAVDKSIKLPFFRMTKFLFHHCILILPLHLYSIHVHQSMHVWEYSFKVFSDRKILIVVKENYRCITFFIWSVWLISIHVAIVLLTRQPASFYSCGIGQLVCLFFLLCKLESLSLSLGFSSDQHLLRTLASKRKLNFYKTLNWHEIVSIKYVDSLSTRKFIFLYLYPHGNSFLVYIVSIPVLLWHFLIV